MHPLWVAPSLSRAAWGLGSGWDLRAGSDAGRLTDGPTNGLCGHHPYPRGVQSAHSLSLSFFLPSLDGIILKGASPRPLLGRSNVQCIQERQTKMKFYSKELILWDLPKVCFLVFLLSYEFVDLHLYFMSFNQNPVQ